MYCDECGCEYDHECYYHNTYDCPSCKAEGSVELEARGWERYPEDIWSCWVCGWDSTLPE